MGVLSVLEACEWGYTPYLVFPVQILTLLHPADLFRDRRAILPSRRDWAKVPDVLAGRWPQHPTLPITRLPFVLAWLAQPAPLLACDTEYDPVTPQSRSHLTMIGLGKPDRSTAVVDWLGLTPPEQAVLVEALQAVFTRTGKEGATVQIIFHNALADWPVLAAHGLVLQPDHVEDTMQAHAVLWSELPHDLEFLQRMYGRYGRHKQLREADPVRYNQGDVLATLDAWDALEQELAADPASHAVYRQQMALLPMLMEAHERGIAVDTAEARRLAGQLTIEADRWQAHAQQSAGWPINLGSEKQVKRELLARGYRLPTHPKTRKLTTDDDALAGLARQHPEDRVIAARISYAKAQQAYTHYVKPWVA